ncbi:MAG: DEAD/DEAH box helicase [Thermoplasmata archaeon]
MRRPKFGNRPASPEDVPVPAGPVALEAIPGIDPPLREALRRHGIERFYPPQAAALGPVLEGRSVVLACPTASGKSLVAYLALLRAARAGRTGLYLVPLRSLAQEKYDELGQFAHLGVKVGLSMGDFDLANPALEKLDILVATSEKADALLRKGSPWLDRLGTVVADEVHLMRDPDRGPTLEVSLTRLRRAHPELQVVALSATVGNSRELASWLGALHVASDFRPVPLKSGVYREGRITFTDLSDREIAPPGEPVPRLVRTVIHDGGQALVFVNTRRASEQLATSLGTTVRALLGATERDAASRVADDLLAVAEEETEGIRRLSTMIPNGVAFHNASLTNGERRVVERAFRDRILKVLVATPTLAAGINLPARRVIVRDTTRYDDRLGMQAPIPALEVQQMCGRAGRPRFDAAGEAVLIARSPAEEEKFLDAYLAAPPEEIQSRLAAEPALRMHLLALVASGEVHSESELEEFFQATFFGHTLPVSELSGTLRTVREFLETNDFLRPGPALSATPFGELTSELYFDPLSALLLRRALERAPIGVRPYPLLAAIAATPDLPPLFLRRGEEPDLFARYTDEQPELLLQPDEEPVSLGLELFLATLKTANVLEAWIDERPILELTDRFGIGAGDLRAKVEDADWLLFGASRIASRFQRPLARPIDELSLRVRYGVRDELLDLVRLRGIGRVRGRLLYDDGWPDREALKGASAPRLARVLRSERLAESVLDEVHRPHAHPRGPAPSEGTPSAPPITPAIPARPGHRGPRRLDEFPSDPDPPVDAP